jgi:hypothetical protein
MRRVNIVVVVVVVVVLIIIIVVIVHPVLYGLHHFMFHATPGRVVARTAFFLRVRGDRQ